MSKLQLTTKHPTSSYNVPVFMQDGDPLDYAQGIRALLELVGKTREQLAVELGVSAMTVTGWINGRMPSTTALKLMQVLYFK